MKIIIFILLFNTTCFSQENSVFWKIEKDNNLSYVLGTNHIFGKTFIEKDATIFDALKKSEIILTENTRTKDLIINARLESKTNELFTTNETNIIKNIVDNNIDYHKLKLKEIFIFSENFWNKISCLNHKEQNELITVDEFVKNFALKEKKIIIGLEKISTTIETVDSLPFEGNDDNKLLHRVKYRLSAIDKRLKHQECVMTDLYRNKKFSFNFDMTLNLYYIAGRNKKWFQTITNALKSKKTTFIAVGIAHLDYKNGLIAMLRKQGYTVTPIDL